MKTALVVAAALLFGAAPAAAFDLNITTTRIPPHWLLDRGPRVIEVPPYDPAPEQSSPSIAVPFHAKTNAEAEAEARVAGRRCESVRLYTDAGLILHRPAECRP